MLTKLRSYINLYQSYIWFGLIALAFIGGIYIRTVFYDAAEKKELQQTLDNYVEAVHLSNFRANKAEEELAALRAANLANDQEVKNEVKKPDYNCKLPDSGKLLINKAITGSAGTSKSGR